MDQCDRDAAVTLADIENQAAADYAQFLQTWFAAHGLNVEVEPGRVFASVRCKGRSEQVPVGEKPGCVLRNLVRRHGGLPSDDGWVTQQVAHWLIDTVIEDGQGHLAERCQVARATLNEPWKGKTEALVHWLKEL